MGYSIGRWVDENGDGTYDALEVETRYFKGPRAFEASGLPLHKDNKTIIKERIYLDKADPNNTPRRIGVSCGPSPKASDPINRLIVKPTPVSSDTP